jgi:pyocin large subunit-like protein
MQVTTKKRKTYNTQLQKSVEPRAKPQRDHAVRSGASPQLELVQTVTHPYETCPSHPRVIEFTPSRAPGATLRLKSWFKPGMWLAHFEKHGASVGARAAVEYVQMAQAAIAHPEALRHIRRDGSRVFYRVSTNEFVVVDRSDNLLTYFKPERGSQYWEKELTR